MFILLFKTLWILSLDNPSELELSVYSSKMIFKDQNSDEMEVEKIVKVCQFLSLYFDIEI